MLLPLLLSACCPSAGTWQGSFSGDSEGSLLLVGTQQNGSQTVDWTVTMDYANGLTGRTSLVCGDDEFTVILLDCEDQNPVGTLKGSLEAATGTWEAAIGDPDQGHWEARRLEENESPDRSILNICASR